MVYLHVPFCRSFCTYCDFYSELACKGKDEAVFARWADEICNEIAARRQEIESTLDLDTLYIGGGTPSVLPLSVLRSIAATFDSIRNGQPYTEFTIEVNPEDIVERGAEYVHGLLDMGVNRISMGVQSLDDGILRWMNRRHSADGARKAYKLIQQGLHRSISSLTVSLSTPQGHSLLDPTTNVVPPLSRGWRRSCEEISDCSPKNSVSVSIDLITGVPWMTMDILEKTVEEVIGWRPDHISAYQLSIEEGSELARMVEKGLVQELDEEACRAQYDFMCRRLAEAGYKHYEISNWALPGHEAIHNSAYWTRHPYVGLGPGAHSLVFFDDEGLPVSAGISQKRFWNSQVQSGWTRSGEDLTPEQIHEEEVMLLARTAKGPVPERDWFIADEIIPDLL
jgi:oxygen-independent coproporphyrinogen-3 oxidase